MNLPLEVMSRYNFHLEELDTGDKLQFWVLMMANLHICEVMDVAMSEEGECDSTVVVTHPLTHDGSPSTSRPARIIGMHSAGILGGRDIWCLMKRTVRNHGRMKRTGFRISFECWCGIQKADMNVTVVIGLKSRLFTRIQRRISRN
jgi:hypothetical protein